MTPVTPKNLLGRLNARTPDQLQRIASAWLIPLQGGDRSRHVGTLYRAMTDIRLARSMWDRLEPDAQAIVSTLALGDSSPATIEELSARAQVPFARTRAAAIQLFQTGLLAREGDSQELPLGALPKLFLPREIGQVFRRVQDEIDAGDLSASTLRVLLETLDDAELEEAATVWGISIIPGQRRRTDLVAQIVRQVASADRVGQIIDDRSPLAHSILDTLINHGSGPLPLTETLQGAGAPPPRPSALDVLQASSRIESALIELETVLLVFHTYKRDGSRWLFVPYEIANPGEVAATLPLRQLQPLPAAKVPTADLLPTYAMAWDMLTVAREVSEYGSPVWVPGEPISRPWQRRLNSRLWLAGTETPPAGYLGTLLYLGITVGALAPSDQPLPAGADRTALRPAVSPGIREWTRLGFDVQQQRLRDAWLTAEHWIEGREREEIEIWGAEWNGFRRRLLDALAGLDDQQWFLVDDLASWVAELNPSLIGTTFTAASARAVPSGVDERLAATTQVVAIELETAFTWLGVAQLAPIPREGLAVRWAASPLPVEPVAGPALTVEENGRILLHSPASLQVWSLSAFADLETLRPQVTYQLRPGSVARALGAGFDLQQITTYLEGQSGAPLPDAMREHLREWTIGFRRVRLRRAIVLQPDAEDQVEDLLGVLAAAGFECTLLPGEPASLLLQFGAPEVGRDLEELLQTTLRSHGFTGQVDGTQRLPRRYT